MIITNVNDNYRHICILVIFIMKSFTRCFVIIVYIIISILWKSVIYIRVLKKESDCIEWNSGWKWTNQDFLVLPFPTSLSQCRFFWRTPNVNVPSYLREKYIISGKRTRLFPQSYLDRNASISNVDSV